MSIINPNTDKCLWTARILGTNPPIYQCLSCFIGASLDSSANRRVTVANLVIKHYFSRGTYIPLYCDKCFKAVTKVKPLNECEICTDKCTKLFTRLTAQGVRVENAEFTYDVHTDRLINLNVLDQSDI